MGQQHHRSCPQQRQSFTAYAAHLQQLFQSQVGTWHAAGIHIDDWAWESHELAESTAYGKLPNSIPIEPDRGEVSSCVVNGDNISQRMLAFNETLAQPYQDDAQPVIEQQLAKGGTRLAMIQTRSGRRAPWGSRACRGTRRDSEAFGAAPFAIAVMTIEPSHPVP
ncbi:MAG: S1/P1 nuclease [Candidatus Binatia bacterium]